MNDAKEKDRKIWSCNLCPADDTTEEERLADLLREKKLPFREDAVVLEEFIRMSGLSQAECARRIGRSQAAVANRLRLRKLPEDVMEVLADAGLTERHARALLRLASADDQRAALHRILRDGMTVAETEALIENCLRSAERTDDLPSEVRGLARALLELLDEILRRVDGATVSAEDRDGMRVLTVCLPKKVPKTNK